MLRQSRSHRSYALLALATVLALLVSMLPEVIPGAPAPTATAHNLQTRAISMFMDPASQALLDNRMAAPGWTPPDPLLQAGDEIGLIIKVVPRDGTSTGVGGHIDFYVPNGVTVLDTAYVVPDGSGGFVKVSMKGQSPIAIGDGPIGAKTTTEMAGIPAAGPNIIGVTELPATAGGLHRGTIAGLYGDTGIFYATDQDTAYGSWQKFTGDWNNANIYANKCGSLAFTAANGKTITNNSGDTVVPCNKWDAEQLFAWGAKGTTYSTAGWPHLPIVDYGDGRGNAPWGFAAGTGGPQSGYAWNFDWDQWLASVKDKPAVQAAMGNSKIGPWQRIRYPGSRIAKDQPGLVSTTLGYANIDGSNVGFALSPATPLPATVSQTDGASPKAIRWAVGQLTAYRPEYAWVKVRVDSVAEITDPTGCPVFHSDTFGGDAGGTDNGKDHLWRYYEPTEATWNGCLAAQKPATREIVKVGDTFQYKLKVYNFQGFTLSSVVVRDTLPGGVTFISAAPAQNGGPNPLVWNVGSLLPGQKWEATVSVTARGTGFLDNCMDISSSQLPTQTVCDSTTSGGYPYLVPSKTASSSTVTPGGTVNYTLLVKNVGTAASASPVVLNEYLPAGFTYQSLVGQVKVNGASVPQTTVNATNPNQPTFTVPAAIQAGKDLQLTFTAKAPANIAPGSYCNMYRVVDNGIPITTGSEACVTAGDQGAGKIGDTIFRDWNGNGAQDAGEEGMPGVTVTLTRPDASTVTAVTDANGQYLFASLAPGGYTVSVPAPGSGGVPAGWSLTADPDGSPYNLSYAKNLATDEVYLGADFGYKPAGAGAIGDQVFDDKDLSATFNAGDAGIPNITVRLYEDGNGNGVIDAGDALVATTATIAGGTYSFNNLATGYKYLVDVDQTDPDLATYFGGGVFTATTSDPHNVGTLAGAYTAADFGFHKDVPPGTFSVGDQVFIDANNNGTYEAGTDTPLPNVGLAIYQDLGTVGVLDAADVLIQTTSSSITGLYTFANLPAGNYLVDINQADADIPAGYTLRSSVNDPTPVTLGPSRTDVDFPFVYVPPPPSPISKAVDKANANPGDTLTYTIQTHYTGSSLLTNATVTDTIPTGTTYVAGSANAGGAINPYTPIAGTPGVDPGAPSSSGTVNTTSTLGDVYIDQNSPTNNFEAGLVSVLPNVTQSRQRVGLMKFDLSGVPTDGRLTIDSATLAVKVDRTTIVWDANVYRMITDWTETAATWNDSDGAGAGDWANLTFSASDYSSTPVYGPIDMSVATPAAIDVTGLVRDWIKNGQPNHGIALLGNLQDTNRADINDSENAGLEPALVINWTIPALRATTNTLSASPTSVYTGNVIQASMVLASDQAISGVTASIAPATLSGTASASCTLTSASPQNISAGGTATFTWNCTASGVGELRFTGNASGTWSGSPYSFVQSTSNSARVLPPGTPDTVTWSLGSNTAGAPGYSAGGGSGWGGNPTTGMAVWYSNSTSATKYNPWNGSGFTGAANTASLGTITQGLQGASTPTRNEKIVLGIDAFGALVGEVWNGSAWTLIPGTSLGAPGFGYPWAYDVAYEQTSGDALVVFADASNTLKYATWNGSSWTNTTAVSDYPTLAGASPAKRVALASKPGSNEIALVVTENVGKTMAWIWNGSSWGSGTLLQSGTGFPNTSSSVAYESLSGNIMVVYGKGFGVTTAFYRIWNGSTWSTEASTAPPGTITTNFNFSTLASDPQSDRIVLGVTTASGTAMTWMNVWDGNAWGTAVMGSATAGSINYPSVDVAFEGTSSEALAVFNDASLPNIYYKFWKPATGWLAVPGLGLNIGARANIITLSPDPNADRIMVAAQDINDDLHYTLWPGNAPFDPAVILETSTGGTAGNNQPFLFLWDNIPWTSSQVSQSSDDAEEAGPDATGSHPPGYMDLTSSDIESTTDNDTSAGYSGGTQKIGLRFNTLNVPQGATITNAYIVVRAEAADAPNTNNGATSLTIRGQAANNPTTFTSTAYDITNRSTTTASVAWSPATWTAGADYSTPDLKTIVQEIANRAGWASGNSMAFIVTGTGSRTAESWDGAGTNPPRLVIEYTIPSGPALRNVMAAAPTLVTAGSTITVTQVLTATQSIASVSPNTLVITGTNGVNATLLTGPTPASATIGAAPTTFTWTYQATGTNIGQLTFGGNATDGSNTWPNAKTNSVIVHPLLTFQATVNNPATVNPVTNKGYIKDASVIPLSPSNTVQTLIGASIGDRVWADLDGGGDQDVGEPGISGVQVCATPVGGGATVCATTDSQGIYHIYGLTNGVQYTVTMTPGTIPANYLPTTASTLTRTASVSTPVTDADFGLRPPGTASIGDTVCLDTGENGCDASDAGLPGITVKLYKDLTNNGLTGDDILMTTTATDASGIYTFTGLYGGDYLVQVDTSSTVTSPYDGTTTIAAAMDLVSGTNPHDVTLSNGQAYTTADFGFNWGGSIGDYVWWDNNINRQQDESTPIANAIVLLYFDANTNGILDQLNGDIQVGFDMTDANGLYLFDNLPPGRYLVDVYEDSITTNGARNIVPTTADVVFKNLGPNEDYLAADFGYYVGAKVEGNVFWDEDHNGVLDGVEQDPAHLLNNVTVNIVCLGADGVAGGGDDYTGSMDTGTQALPNGHFAFIVPPGPCTLTYDQPDIPAQYTDRTTPTSYTFTAVGGEDWHPSFDFGVDHGGKLGDTVWNDVNGNGVQDGGEPGFANVTLDLYLDADGNPATINDQTYLGNDVTDAFGKYEFVGLPDTTGSQQYVVKVVTSTLTFHYEQTSDPDDATPPCTGGECDNQGLATLTAGNSHLDDTVDFGYQYKPGGVVGATFTIAGFVWQDTSGEGTKNPGEPVIPGATVTVDCGPNGVFTTVSTANTFLSNWSVVGIPQGATCTIDVNESTLPSPAYVATTPATRTVTNIQNDVTGQNFGYKQWLGSISGTACSGNLTGDCVGGEPALSGVTVTLRYAGSDGILGTIDDVVSPRQTDVNGNYSFLTLTPGLYQVIETNPTNYSSLSDADSPNGFGNPDNITLTLDFGLDGIPGNADDRLIRINQDFEDAPPVDLSLAKSDRFDPAVPGSSLTYTITIANAGPGIANNVVVTDTLPAQVTFASATPGYTGPNPLVWNVGSLNVNATRTFTIAVTTNLGFTGVITNTATVRTTSSEPDLTNNSDQEPTTIATPASLGDFIYFDANGNGTQQSGETSGINGVTVTAVNQVTGQTYTTTTVNGAYLLSNLPPGTYSVSVPPSAPGMVRTSASPVIVTLLPGQNRSDVDFGYISPTGTALSSFTAEAGAGGVLLRWATMFEDDIDGFVVWRAPQAVGDYTAISDLIPSQDPTGASYEWLDASAESGQSYWYKLQSQPDGQFFGPILTAPEGGFKTLFTPLILRLR